MTNVFYQITEAYTVEQMFNLVNDINAYPQFIPDCANAGILKHQDNTILAYLEVEKLGFKKKFITSNKLQPYHKIDMRLVDGPFKRLEGCWTFVPLDGNRCQISFDLSFEFKNRLLDLTFTPLFKDLMENMVKAFSLRAKQIYSE